MDPIHRQVLIKPSCFPDIVGTWKVDEYSETYDATTYFDIRIFKSLDYADEILITNFYDVNIEVHAYVEGNRIVIPFQERNGFEIEGTGTIRSQKITFIYSVFDRINGGLTDYCDSVAW